MLLYFSTLFYPSIVWSFLVASLWWASVKPGNSLLLQNHLKKRRKEMESSLICISDCQHYHLILVYQNKKRCSHYHFQCLNELLILLVNDFRQYGSSKSDHLRRKSSWWYSGERSRRFVLQGYLDKLLVAGRVIFSPIDMLAGYH